VIKKDYIVVGQGIAGSMLAWFLQKRNKSFMIIDDAKPNAASRIAAGIIHPITGRRIVKTWMADQLIPFAESTYTEIENHFHCQIFHPTSIVELLSSPKEFNDWMTRSEEQNLATYIDPSFHSNAYDNYLQPFSKKILIKKSSWIDTTTLLNKFRSHFEKEEKLLDEKFQFENLELKKEAVNYKGISASKIIFCDGGEALKNPFWKHLPFLPSKGEIIIIKAEMKLEHILNRKIFILPLGDNLFKVGSTYSWKYENEFPTVEAKEELMNQLKSVIKIPFEVVDQAAGIRPTVKDRRPMLGLHSDHKQVGVFNGLGTKGCLLAPFFANHLTGFLDGRNQLIPEADVSLINANG
jgi:glycine oxidase